MEHSKFKLNNYAIDDVTYLQISLKNDLSHFFRNRGGKRMGKREKKEV